MYDGSQVAIVGVKVAYVLLASHVVLTACVLFRLRVPWVFASPPVFALVTVALILPSLWWIERVRSRDAYKAALFGYCLAVLLAFPLVFDVSPLPGYTFSGYHFGFVVLLFAHLAVFYSLRAALDDDPPVIVWIVITPLLVVGFDWFFFRYRSLGGLIVVVSLVAVGVGVHSYWKRSRGAR